MKPEYLALALVVTTIAVVGPSAYSALQGHAYGGLVIVLPVVPCVVFILHKFVPWDSKEDDAQLTRLLKLFGCGDAAHVLRGLGVQTTTDLEYITPEALSTLGLPVVTKAKLEDALRCPLRASLHPRAEAVSCSNMLRPFAGPMFCRRQLRPLPAWVDFLCLLRRHAGARGWTKQVFEAKDGTDDARCKICDKPSSEHHGPAKYCRKRCADAVAKLIKMQIPQLYAACREDDDKALQALITAGADVNVVDTEGRSPLHCACHWGKSSVVASLISSRANLYAKSSQGHTPMHFAVESGSSQCVRMLLEAGVSAKEAAGETRSTPLHWACSKRALQVCELLIKYGADVNAADINGNQPLHEGGMGSAEARLLIKHKADVNARDRNQRCPLHKFAYVGTRSVCVTLLEANAQPDAKDAEGN